jgi:hypothetical protein
MPGSPGTMPLSKRLRSGRAASRGEPGMGSSAKADSPRADSPSDTVPFDFPSDKLTLVTDLFEICHPN